jgi:hypothetical protein
MNESIVLYVVVIVSRNKRYLFLTRTTVKLIPKLRSSIIAIRWADDDARKWGDLFLKRKAAPNLQKPNGLGMTRKIAGWVWL